MNWKKKRTMTAIIDLQFGSCGKGLLAGHLAIQNRPDTIVSANSANAGHTFIDKDGVKMVTTAIPSGIVSDSVKTVLLGPGSVIDPEKLFKEIEEFANPRGIRVCVHEHAAIITEDHRVAEQHVTGMVKIGSTMKGVGEATIQKIRRDPHKMNIARNSSLAYWGYVVPIEEYNSLLDSAVNVQVEGAQGFSLGINNGMYPYTTSRECTIAQLLSDCAIPFGDFNITVVGACRAYPIRVSNRYDDGGKMVGWSGPCYDDQKELKWSDIGVIPELTTVTRLERRVFDFSMEQIRQAVRMNGVNYIFLNFANYMKSKNDVEFLVFTIENEIDYRASVKWLGWGPQDNEIEDYCWGAS